MPSIQPCELAEFRFRESEEGMQQRETFCIVGEEFLAEHDECGGPGSKLSDEGQLLFVAAALDVVAEVDTAVTVDRACRGSW